MKSGKGSAGKTPGSNKLSLEDQAAVKTTLLRMYWSGDHNQLERVPDFHTEDAVVTSNVGHNVVGRKAILALAMSEVQGPGSMFLHVMTAVQVALNEDGTVEAKSTVLRFSNRPDPPVGGGCLLQDVEYTLVRANAEDGWLVSKRHVDILFPLAGGGGFRGPNGPPGGRPGGTPPG